MRIEDVIAGVKSRRAALQEAVFKSPPQDFMEFQKRLGVWVGLGETLAVIEGIRKKEGDEDYS